MCAPRARNTPAVAAVVLAFASSVPQAHRNPLAARIAAIRAHLVSFTHNQVNCAAWTAAPASTKTAERRPRAKLAIPFVPPANSPRVAVGRAQEHAPRVAGGATKPFTAQTIAWSATPAFSPLVQARPSANHVAQARMRMHKVLRNAKRAASCARQAKCTRRAEVPKLVRARIAPPGSTRRWDLR